MARPENIERTNEVGVLGVPALDAEEQRLRLAVVGVDVAARRTGLAGVRRRDRQQFTAVPPLLVLKLPAKLAPALIQDGAVETRFLPDLAARSLDGPLGRPRIPALNDGALRPVPVSPE